MARGPRVAAKDRRTQILDVAAAEFARQGFDGTTTRAIAAHAGINEAIIFRHFASKEDLYREVLEMKARERGANAYVRQRLTAGGDLRQMLLEITESILRSSTQDATLTRLFFYSGLEAHQLSHRFYRSQIMEGFRLFVDLVQKLMDRGVLRSGDALGVARTFYSMVMHHILMHNLFGEEKQFTTDPHQAAAMMVDTWLDGVLPDGSPLRRPTGGRTRRGARRARRAR